MDYMRLYLIIFSTVVALSNASPVTVESVEWKYSRTLYDYKFYGAISLERIEIPPHSISINLTMNAFSDHDSCSTRKVNVYYNQDGIPVVSRDGEVFPEDAATPEMVPNVTMATDNKTTSWVLHDLHEGSFFLMAVLPHSDTRIRQKGLYVECSYYISVQAVISHYLEGTVPIVTSMGYENYSLKGPTKRLTSFRVPPDTSSFNIKVEGCQTPGCKMNVFLWDTLSPEMWSKSDKLCILKNGLCVLEKTSPRVDAYSYLGLDLTSDRNESVKVTLTLNVCTNRDGAKATGGVNNALPKCVQRLGRETTKYDNNFEDRFTLSEAKSKRPSKKISLAVSDNSNVLISYALRDSDTGGTLNIALDAPDEIAAASSTKQGVEVTLCVSQSKIISSSDCLDGTSIETNSEDAETSRMIPYPKSGAWFVSIHTLCFQIDGKSGRTNVTVPCDGTPLVNLTVGLSSCDKNSCGDYGSCKLYTGAGMVYSACVCQMGWRGYACNDGSKALSMADQKLSIFLLTFSNLAFIPGICLALYRRYFIEAFVYTYNMFFSTFYHACDRSYIYNVCIMTYDALSFADFFSSLMSFAVTLLAMSRIPKSVRSFLHMFSVMFIALGEVYNRHGLIEQLLPIAGGLGLVAFSWGYEMYKRRRLFPSKKRYLKFILPGIAFALLGICLNLAVETDDNYKYVHSTWHLLVASSIVFLLPPRRHEKWSSGEEDGEPLSIQSGDVTVPAQPLFSDNGQVATGFQNAASGSSEPTSHNEDMPIRLMARSKRGRQNYVM